MNNIALGRYIPMNTVIHNLDPRYKIMAMLTLMVAVFLPSGFYGYSIIAVFVFVVLLLAKVKIQMIVRALRPMIFMLSFLLVINILIIRTGYVLVSFQGFTIYSDAIFQTLYITVRLFLMIIISTLLTISTKPLDMTLGLEDLLGVFKRFGFPAHEVAMMISIALRFIPTLIDETSRIMKAQASRGVDLKEGSFKEKIMAILSLIVPLFVSSFQRAEELADAMEARGYAPSAKRTRYKQLKTTYKDVIAMGLVLSLLGGIIWISL
ncbi:MAG: energy-coupling factor transporter transmembrane component T [Erysipelotrichaceae bacterium]